jgi:SAM-dependent methyltransferase
MTNSMRYSGNDNVGRVQAGQMIDSINAEFYGRFQYPWPPYAIHKHAESRFESEMLSQSIGEWGVDVLPARPRIWVAGCGTNQAVLTAVSFPNAQVLGTDLSAESIAASQRLAGQLGVTNLDLRVESINEAGHHNEFDYVICTGVIHHNADPQAALAKLSRAVKPDGLLQLMVYNYYHCIEAVAVQNAIGILASAAGGSGLDDQLQLASQIIGGRDDLKMRIEKFFPGTAHFEPAFADALIQPVAHTFTVLQLRELAASCDLDLILPCVNGLDVARNCFDWHIEMSGDALRAAFEGLSDVLRWQVINLIGLDKSPMLWFYLRPDSPTRIQKSEQDIVAEFSDQSFEITETASQAFFRTEEGTYKAAEGLTRHPGRHRDETCQKIVDIVADRKIVKLRDVLAELAIPTDFAMLNRLRVRLTTTSFPYLRACG